MSIDLAGLNPEQRRAVETIEGPVLCLAGAGSGKTRVLTHRIAYMLEQRVRPWEILAVTFTNKAAAEMKERVRHLVGSDGDRIMVTTFHSACVRFLRQDAEAVGLSRDFSIVDDDDQKSIIDGLMDDLGITDRKKWPPAALRSRIDRAKNARLSPQSFEEVEGRLPVGDPFLKVWMGYDKRLGELQAVDFNDIINKVVDLLVSRPEIRARYQERFRYVMVDEYQDTNRAQFELIDALVGKVSGRSRNVMVVGDDDQSIYSFRGADIRNILDFQKSFPEATTIRLEQNYRSLGTILRAANAVVKNNKGRMDKELRPTRPEGEKLSLMIGQDPDDEAAQVVAQMRKLGREGRRWADMAVIYRTNAASRSFEGALMREKIPYVLVGARKFYDRAEVKNIVSYLKLALNPADDMACQRVINVPSRKLGPKAVEEMRARAAAAGGVPLLEGARQWAREGGRGRKAAADFVDLMDRLREATLTTTPEELVLKVARESGYLAMLEAEGTDESQGRIDNIHELVRSISANNHLADSDPNASREPIDRLRSFLDTASLASQADELPDDPEGRGQVTLLTAHLAKGLEYPLVFVVGMYEGGFPHFRAREREEDIEEERRLVYVAFTRAMDRLFISRPRRRLVPGSGFEEAEMSRFLKEVPTSLVTMSGGGGFSTAAPEVDRASRMARLGFGDAPPRPAFGGGPSRSVGVPPPLPRVAGAPIPTPPASSPARPLTLPGIAPSLRPVASVPPPDGEDEGSLRTRMVTRPEQLEVGSRVVHEKFGRGTVRKLEGRAPNIKVTIHFDKEGPKPVFLQYAQLEVILP